MSAGRPDDSVDVPVDVPRRLALALAAAAAGACALAADLARAPATRADLGSGFQRAVGGIGTGPGLDLAGCAAAFDAREVRLCPDRFGPVPCGTAWCPHRGEGR